MAQLPIFQAIDGTYYVKHSRSQWRTSVNGGKVKLLHHPSIRYESPIKNYERHQLLRAIRKTEI